MIKRFISKIMAVLVTFAVISTCAAVPAMAADETYTVYVQGTYNQTAARSMLTMVNQLRTGSNAWVWNSSDTEKVYYSNLSELKYDYDLEKIAMQRAVEIALEWGHTRPDGTTCFSAYSGYSYSGAGENIAIGYSSASAAFTGWCEENEKYSGQGHRRNMLSSGFTNIGIACVVVNGTYCWVQEFSKSTGNTTPTTANDAQSIVPVNILSSNIASVQLSRSKVSVNVGSSVSVSDIYAAFTTTGQWLSGSFNNMVALNWTISDSSVASYDQTSGKVIGLKVGTTALTTQAFGKTLSLTINVNEEGSAPEIDVDENYNGWYVDDYNNVYYLIDGTPYNQGIITMYNFYGQAAAFYFASNGIMQTGWVKYSDGIWLYFSTDETTYGQMQTGWLWAGAWYYLGEEDANYGIMQTGWVKVNGTWYYMNAGGAMASNQWVKSGSAWYYMNSNGTMACNQWIKSGNTWYYMNANGTMACNQWVKSGGAWYYMNSSGTMTCSQWVKSGNAWYYMNANGTMACNQWVKSGSSWYYMNANGIMVTNTTLNIGGVNYKFDSNGVWVG